MIPQKNIYMRMARYMRPYLPETILAVSAMGVVAATTTGTVYLVKPVMDGIFAKGAEGSMDMLYKVAAAIVALFTIKGIFFYVQSYVLGMVGQKIIMDIRSQVVDHLMRQDLQYFHRTTTSDLISRIWNDISVMNQAVSQAITAVAMHILTMVGLAATVFYFNWKLASLSFFVFPIAVYPIARFSQRLRNYTKKGQKILSQMNEVLVEGFTGIRVVKAFNMEAAEARRFETQERSLLNIIRRFVRIKSISFPIMEFIGAVGVAAILLLAGSMVVRGGMTQGDFFSFMTALLLLYDPVKKMNGTNHLIQSGAAAAERVFELLDSKPAINDAPDAVALTAVKDKIALRDVHFRYEAEGDEVLKGVTLEVKVGQVVALVGPSGGGKTTIVNLIPRFYEVTGGAIEIDGQDIRAYTQHSLRSVMAVVTQQTILFNDTIRNNICYGTQGADDARVVAAAKAANAHEFIAALPEGYDTMIGEQGVKLSGGQRQRISIARAILKDAPILILDEATSALDTESEKEVQRALDNLMVGRTTFVIAHRLSTIRNADMIVTIVAGRVAETGTHDELLAKGGEYAKLYHLQFEKQEAGAAAQS